MTLSWEHVPRTDVCAALSWTPEGADHYVVSHRCREHTVSWRPPGQHVHVSTWTTKAAALRAAQAHYDARHRSERGR